MRRSFQFVSVLSVVLVLLVISLLSASTPADPSRVNLESQDIYNYGKIPILFIENKKQLMDESVRYFVTGTGATAFFKDAGVAFDIAVPYSKADSMSHQKYTSTDVASHIKLKVDFAGASPKCRVQGIDEARGKTNVISGSDPSKWKTNIALYKGIIYKDVWKGIDISYAGMKKQVKYDIIIRPGAKVSDIKLRYKGIDKLFIDKKGDLHIKTANASFTETLPGIHQTKSGKQIALKGGYVLLDKQTVGFRIKGADPRLPIVIDPASDLVYSTLIGGTRQEWPYDIAVDSLGCLYITGSTYGAAFPTTEGAFDRTGEYGACQDAFVVKLNATGTEIIYSTYLQGERTDEPHGICVDNSGCAYVTGLTTSMQYPVTPGAISTSYNGSLTHGFITKLNPQGSALEYSTFFGGDGTDYLNDIALDGDGCAYVTGLTSSTDFPVTPGAYKISLSGYDAFVSKVNPAGTGLIYSTLVGGTNYEEATSIAIDDTGYAYITGRTYSSDYPVTEGAFDTSFNADEDGFVTKLNPSATALMYSTYIGGNASDTPSRIVVDDEHCAYIIGGTYSTDFPITPGVFDQIYDAGMYKNAFITCFNVAGSDLEYSTFFSDTSLSGLAVDDQHRVYIVGYTSSSSFPTTPDAFDITFNSNEYGDDAYITRFNPSATDIEYSTFFGGIYSDMAYGICLGVDGCVYITGRTNSSDFPITPGSYGGSIPNGDIFVAKMNLNRTFRPDLLMKAGSSSYGCNNIYSNDGSGQSVSQNTSTNQTVSYGFRVQNDGSTNDTFKITGTGGGDGWTVKYCDLNTNADVTAQVTGEGWASGSLAPGATNGVYVFVTPDGTVAAGTSKSLIITTASQSDISKKDIGEAVTTNIPLRKPDILAKAGFETSYSFNNIYSMDGNNQTKSLNASMNQTVNYAFRVQNDGNANDTFKITGTAGTGGWMVRYYDLTTNADVTSQVTGSGWSSGTLAPGATNGVYAKVTPGNGASSGSINTLLITAVSQGDITKKDVCKAVTMALPSYKTDILMKAGAETSYSFDNIYGTDGSNQTKTLNASTNQKVNFAFRVQNDGNIADTFKITGPTGGSGWTVVYKDLTTNADVTAQVTGSGWTSGSLAPGATNGVYVFVTPDSIVPAGNTKTLTITAASQSDASTRDVCRAVTIKQ